MKTVDNKQIWDEYCKSELKVITPILSKLGFTLDQIQVHIGGERYLMAIKRDVGGGGKKLVLTGHRNIDGKRVIIKISRDIAGIEEIKHERKCRDVLQNINFAYRTFFSPEELLFTKQKSHIIFITTYIEERTAFLQHSMQDQFFLAMRAFEVQESVHATTSSHTKIISKTFGLTSAKNYLDSFDMFESESKDSDPNNNDLALTFNKANNFLHQNKNIIEQYCDFLTHSDFVPHNLRVVDRDIYLLDYSALHFGNKYESFGRFSNYMAIYNPELRMALFDYVKKNRGEEEYLSLRLMCIYKLGFILKFHTGTLANTAGNMNELSKERIGFWIHVMESVLDDKPVPEELVKKHHQALSSLRSEEEIRRQKELKQI